MFENKREKLLPRRRFYRRLFKYWLVAFVFIAVSLGMGVAGYHYWGKLDWLSSFYNASMILGGMGPADTITSSSGKIFASLYALYSGVAFIGACAILFAPIVHRFFHVLHLETKSGNPTA